MKHPEIQKILQALSKKVTGKEEELTLVLCAFFARGHILLEDLPGLGKTTIAKAIANVLGLQFQRIQGSSDLMPSDILGIHIFDPEKKSFEFQKGPVFTQILLFDEMNRTLPKRNCQESDTSLRLEKTNENPHFLYWQDQGPLY